MIRLLFSCMLLLIPAATSLAQLSSCTNADFELNSFVNWNATTGWCCPVNSTVPGIVAGRHTIMTGPGTDPNTNGAVTVVAPGGQYSARLGNDNIGAEAEQLSYQINVDTSNALFIYRYAVVLEDPNHTPQEQPRFEIRVYDQNGLAVGCGTYNVYASAGIPGFVTIVNSFGSTIHYKDWTTVGIDLSPYIGQMVTIEFSTGDCALGGHFGYAYVDCYCSPLKILTDFCSGANATTLTAPIGFESYAWNTGDTTQSITVVNAIVGTQYQCTMTSVTGCTITLTAILTPTVIAGAYGQTALCQNATQFMDSSVVITGTPIQQWDWDFGDGSSSTLQHPLHSFPAAGNYTVSLTVTNMGGCRDSITQTVIVNPVPVPSFSTAPVCPGSSVFFTDGSSSPNGPVNAWYWDFGDGTPPDTLQHPSHIYNAPGTYPVLLVISDSLGCRDSLLQNLSTLPGPVAGFSYVSACVNSQIAFQDTSLVAGTAISSWEWNFGDGSPVFTGTPTPVYGYPGSGSYTATLVITATNGCTDTVAGVIDVQSVPVAAFTNNLACEGQVVQFNDMSATIVGSVNAWHWDFGDGTASSSVQHPVHSYATGGNYTVTLIATGSNGCSDTVIQQVTVLPSPLAAFTTSPACPGTPAQFTSQSVFGAGTITAWQWDFGDGSNPANGASSQHVFNAAGSYVVHLVVTASNGCIDSVQHLVTTAPLPVAAYFIPSGCAKDTVLFANLSSVNPGNLVSFTWDFDDGSAGSNASSPTHVFNGAGTFYVQLTAVSDQGCLASVVNEVTVFPLPQAAFTAGAACPGDTSQFTDISTTPQGSISGWSWNFGDGTPVVSGVASPAHVYPGSGSYPVQLVAISSLGCRDTVMAFVGVKEAPVAAFSTIGPYCESSPVATSNTSFLPGGTIVSNQWDFGNGNGSNLANPVIGFQQPGSFIVSLIVTGSNACRDTMINTIQILPAPDPVFSTQNACEETPVLFSENSLSASPLQSWNWNFGDGDTSQLPAPVHSYQQPGTFQVYLKITNADGCSADTLLPIVVYPEPLAAFTHTDQCPGVPVPFTDQSTIVAGSTVSSWEWNFGDASPLSTIQSPVHLYPQPGTYTVSMVATSSFGCRDTAWRPVTVYPLPQASFSTDTVCEGLPTSFSNRSVIASGSIVSWNWIFGDGFSDNAYTPSHVYVSGGNYTATLFATSDKGCSDSVSLPVRIWHLPDPALQADVRSGCEPLQVYFNDSSSALDGVINSWIWDFGDNSTGSGASTGNLYSGPGLYGVSLQVTTTLGCTNDTVYPAYIEVFPNPVAAFRYDPEHPGVFMPEVNFYDQSAGASQWHWDFGDTATPVSVSTEQHPVYRYTQPGEYTVMLIVISAEGCRDTVWKVLEVRDDFVLWIPNAFSPNQDGSNDLFQVKGFGYSDYEMSIFNRWGQRIYASTDDAKGWDGTCLGEQAAMDVYVYRVDIKDVFGNPHSYTGRVTLVR